MLCGVRRKASPCTPRLWNNFASHITRSHSGASGPMSQCPSWYGCRWQGGRTEQSDATASKHETRGGWSPPEMTEPSPRPCVLVRVHPPFHRCAVAGFGDVDQWACSLPFCPSWPSSRVVALFGVRTALCLAGCWSERALCAAGAVDTRGVNAQSECITSHPRAQSWAANAERTRPLSHFRRPRDSEGRGTAADAACS